MPSNCSVIDCKNNLRQKQKREISDPSNPLVFHRFPHPVKNKAFCNIWIEKCKRDFKSFNINSATVCSDHFTPDDYERDLRNELLGLKTRKFLKQTAIPTIFPSREERPKRKESAASRRRKLAEEVKARKELIAEILKEHSNESSNDNTELNSVRITVTPSISQEGFDLQIKEEPPEVIEYEDFPATDNTDNSTNNDVPADAQDLTSVLSLQRNLIDKMGKVIQKQRTEIIRLTNINKLQKLVNKTTNNDTMISQ